MSKGCYYGVCVLLNVFGSERNISTCVITYFFKEDIFTLLSYYHFSTFGF